MWKNEKNADRKIHPSQPFIQHRAELSKFYYKAKKVRIWLTEAEKKSKVIVPLKHWANHFLGYRKKKKK